MLLWALVPRLADRREFWPALFFFHQQFWRRVAAAAAPPTPPSHAAFRAAAVALKTLASGVRAAGQGAGSLSPRTEMTPLAFYCTAADAAQQPRFAALLATLAVASCRGRACAGHGRACALAALRADLQKRDLLGQQIAALAADECTAGPCRTRCRQQLARALATRADPPPDAAPLAAALLSSGQLGLAQMLTPQASAATGPHVRRARVAANLILGQAESDTRHTAQRFVAAARLQLCAHDGTLCAYSDGRIGLTLSLACDSASGAVTLAATRNADSPALLPHTQLRLAAAAASQAAADAVVRAAQAWARGLGGTLVADGELCRCVVHRRVSFSSAEPRRAFAEVPLAELQGTGCSVAEGAQVLLVVYGETADLDPAWRQRPAEAWLNDWAPALRLDAA